MITFNAIEKEFSHNNRVIRALDDINLEVKKGEIFGIVGESGAGKSTLIRCANLLETPTRGEVIIDGQKLTELSSKQLLNARHNVGMIFQHFNLLSSRTVYQNIALPLELTGNSKKTIDEKVRSLLTLTGLTDKAHHYPAQLSGGQKQRVAIARALANDPKVLLSDEATSALDPETTESILELLKDINKQLGLTILLITHEMAVVKRICDKVALIQAGKLVESNSVGAFFTNPQSDLGKHFVNKSNAFSLPKRLQEKLQAQSVDGHDAPIVKLQFNNNNVHESLISKIAREFAIDISILQANIENIQSHTLGLMIAQFNGDKEKNQAALNYLENTQVNYEVLGYVKRNV